MCRCLLLAILVLLTGPAAGRAYLGPPPLWQQLAASDCVVVGRLVAMEEKVETAHDYNGKQVEWYVGLVKISDPLWNARGLTHVRVGFLAPGNGERSLSHVAPGKDSCFILQRHPTEPFFTTNGWVDGIVHDDREPADFQKWVAALKRYGQLLADPPAGLAAKDADDRLATAALLLARYGAPQYSGKKCQPEPISAEESRLILQTILKGDWMLKEDNGDTITPYRLATTLCLAAGPSFPPAAFKHQKGTITKEATRKWLEENVDVYRIQHYVPVK